VTVRTNSNSAQQIVPFVEAHLSIFTEWFNALPGNDVWTEESVLDKSIRDKTYDPALMFAVETDHEPVGFLLGSIANEVGWIRAFLVRPDRQCEGIGTAMFDTIEAIFAERGVSDVNVGWALPKYFLPGIDIRYTSAIVFLDRRGYQTTRETRINMDIMLTGRDFDTTESESRLRKQGITVRRGQYTDRPGIDLLCETYSSPGWAVETGFALTRDPVTAFVAERDGEICAFATHSVCGPVHFGPMLTADKLRGMGIGSVLLKRCLQDWQRKGVERCEVVWAGPLSFYGRSVGATMGRAFWTYHKSL
jgi:mycothiol synthase